MVSVNGFLAFHGDALISKDGNNPFFIKDEDFLYDPTRSIWITNDSEFDADCVKCFEYNHEDFSCSEKSYGLNLFGSNVDPCVYDVVEQHDNVSVEILKCRKCGKIEISWFDPKEIGELF